jgi:prepilin-type N-terminal cleavage/methylation domain-containing protein
MKPGFTLPEVLLAILLFAVGFLGLVASATAIAAQVGDTRELTRAALLAGAVLDSLRGSPCVSVVGGSRAGGRASLTWTAAPGPSTVGVRATLALPGRTGPRAWALETLLPCDR